MTNQEMTRYTELWEIECTDVPATSEQERSVARDKAQECEDTLARLAEEESSILELIEDIDSSCERRKQPLLSQLQLVQERRFECKAALFEVFDSQEKGIPTGPARLEFVDGAGFSAMCIVVVFANLVVMVIEVESPGNITFHILDCAFLLWYCIELSLRAAYHRRGFLYGRVSHVGWNWLDLFVVVCGIFDQWIIPLLSAHTYFSVLNFNTSQLRALRLLRLLRIAQVFKVFRFAMRSDFKWTEHAYFESFMMGVILVNALLMWLELDLRRWYWEVAEHILLTIYTFEYFVRVKRWGTKFFSGQDFAWNILDSIIVVGGILDQWVLPAGEWLFREQFAQKVQSQPSTTSAMKAFRMVRVARVLRLGRLLRGIKPLHRLMTGILEAMQAIGWSILLTFILLYSTAIVFTTLVGKGYIYSGDPPPRAEDFFGTVLRSMLSLFKLMNDDQGVVEPIINNPVGQVLFCIFMVISNWMMLAILTSVVSDHMISASQRCDREEHEKALLARQNACKRRLMQLFTAHDPNQSGGICESTFEAFMQDEETRHELCDATGLDAMCLQDLFKYVSLRHPRKGRILPYEDFIEALKHEGTSARERSILQMTDRLQNMELRLEHRLNKILDLVGASEHDVQEMPSLVPETLGRKLTMAGSHLE
mmetsp:Transcript_93824/g.265049  ORF Transcript_93824/g.265049 Transcript_93824/m.265049 type:complete len:652 (-) Transcript_93824:240-2195(-)|eukprot:CAMPEP_0117471546 /NCGR_PEP_ID=MMETSP0784-20121206/7785_1 /TAXON_ID=39447 /ORGANISM="" /LENGTH=651 /DNA_ID=CAMNT_0005265665 /DNA_START=104 /DNA_END=2059 /DNA_ORIENTATION=-